METVHKRVSHRATDAYILLIQVISRNNFEEGWESLFASNVMRSEKKFEDKFTLSAAQPQDQITDFQLYQTIKDSLNKNELKYTYIIVEE